MHATINDILGYLRVGEMVPTGTRLHVTYMYMHVELRTYMYHLNVNVCMYIHTSAVRTKAGQQLKSNVLLHAHLRSMDLENVTSSLKKTSMCVIGGGRERAKR